MLAPSAILFDLGGTVLEERRFVLEAGIRAVVGDRPQAIAELTQAFRAELQDHHRVHRELLLSQWLMQRLPLDVPINPLEDL
ncbi:MAG TPA: hypothetical protein VKM54_18600, partial [Myxococcota bacterium]|nr:hypothetical protein [Myxococcota bacterium]